MEETGKNIYFFILTLITLGLILGVGILILDKFGTAAKENTNANQESITISSGTGTTANNEVVSVSFFGNSTHNTTNGYMLLTSPSFNVTLNSGIVHTNFSTCAGCHISYVYKTDTSATTTLSNVVTAISPIASVWFALIVTIFILAIILGMVIKSFSQQR